MDQVRSGMKIVIAVHHFPPNYSGGAEWRAYRTAKELQNRGHEVRVVCVERVDAPSSTGMISGLSWVDDVFEGIQVRRLSFDLGQAPDPSRWEYDNAWIGEHLHGYFRREKPDVFHLISGYLMTGSAVRAAMQIGIPTVITLTDFWFLCPRVNMLRSNGDLSTLPIEAGTCARCKAEEQRRFSLPALLNPQLMNLFWRIQKTRTEQIQRRMDFLSDTLNQVDVLISPSRFLRAMFVQSGFSEQRIIFSRQGRDIPNLNHETIDKNRASDLRVGYLGQITPIKGVHVLFEAVRQMPGAALTVQAYGDLDPFPEYTHRLQKLAREDKRLSLEGKYTDGGLTSILSRLDVIVVPSEWYENSPNVILEAFAHRIPVIASNLGGMAEMVRHGENGLLFETGDPADLRRQLTRLLEEPGLLPSLQQGIEHVKSLREEIDELEGIYQAVRERNDLPEEVILT